MNSFFFRPEKLSSENTSLRTQLKAAGGTIIEVREKVDQKKLKKILSNLPIKKSKKVVNTSTIKGKDRDVKKKD